MSREVRMVRARDIVGKTIVGFKGRATRDAARGSFVHQPVIFLSDGSHLFFVTEETDSGASYGTFIDRAPKPRRRTEGR